MKDAIMSGFISAIDAIDEKMSGHTSCFAEKKNAFRKLCGDAIEAQSIDIHSVCNKLDSFRDRFVGILGDHFPLFANDMPLDFFEEKQVEERLETIISKADTEREIDFRDGDAVQQLQDDIKKRGIAEKLLTNVLSRFIAGLGDGFNRLDISFAPLLKNMSEKSGTIIHSELLGQKLGIVALRAACCLAPVQINQDRFLDVCKDGPRTQAAKAWIKQKIKYDTGLKNHVQGIEWSSDFNNDKGIIYPKHPGEPPSKPEDADGVDRWAQGVLARHGLE